MKHLFLTICLMLLIFTALAAEQFTIGNAQNEVRVITSDHSQIVLEMTLGHFNREAVSIEGQTWYHLNLKKSGLTEELGLPQVPILAGSVIIPNNARMELSNLDSEYVEYTMPIAPSKGVLTRDVDPASIPYTFDQFYNTTRHYPQQTAMSTEPFVMRDYRGMTVRFTPFVYYPATQTLRIYTRLRVALTNNGTDFSNSLSSTKSSHSAYFDGIYRNFFLNFSDSKYPTLEEEGSILVIKNSMFDTVMQPWVDWKRQKGFEVEVVDVTVAGPTASQIQTFIANRYNQNQNLTFVQIFGDAPQVPTLTSGGGGSDPSYTLITGNDAYPELFIGRFSAQNVADMQTQVLRTVHYERDIQVGNDWIQRATGIASNEGGGSQGDMGESDQVHMELIRTDLLNYGYTTVDQAYQNNGITAAQLATYFNNGRGFVNYVGHGSNTSWVTTGFNNNNVNALTNDYMLPFIVSVACVSGNFVSMTCFAEAWLMATNNTTGNPTGAIAHYASTINQSWNSPMRAQDEITDLLVAEEKHTIGGLFFNGSALMVEVYGTDGANMFKTWHIFGDASLMARTKNPVAATATYNPVLFLGMNNFEVITDPNNRVALSHNGVLLGSAIANAAGIANITLTEAPQEPMDMTLTITGFNKETHLGTVQVLPSTGPYVVVGQMVVTDDNNNVPEYGETINLNIVVNNVGSDAANAVTVFLSTSDPYLNLLSFEETIGDIPANQTATTDIGFDIQIAGNVPDQHSAQVGVMISSGDEVWEYTRSFTINAPAFSFNALQVVELDGDGNGRIDAGETVLLTIPIENVGHAQANQIMAVLMIEDVPHISEAIINNYTALPNGATVDIVYQVTFSSQIAPGTTVPITLILAAGDYAEMYSTSTVVGLMMEDFENGFNNYPWSFTGGNWSLDDSAPYSGNYSAKSFAITHNQSTSMSVTMNVPEAGDISFWKKVSSEANYDYMKFYINNVLKNQWSGTVAWSEETFAVLPGNTTFKWEYMKDNIVSSGSDCAWIDNIIFPVVGGVQGSPSFAIDLNNIDYGSFLVGETVAVPLTIMNTGTALMIGEMQVNAPFYLIPAGSNPLSVVSYIVPAESELEIMVAFMPSQAGDFTEFLSITSDDPSMSMMEIELTATATPVSNPNEVVPVVTELKGNYPNPFNPTTTIQFSVKDSGPVSIDVYNVLGQKVRTLVNGQLNAGNHSITWNGRDDRNRNVASGIYFYRMRAGSYSQTKKMVMMK